MSLFRALGCFQEALGIQKHDQTYLQLSKLHTLMVGQEPTELAAHCLFAPSLGACPCGAKAAALVNRCFGHLAAASERTRALWLLYRSLSSSSSSSPSAGGGGDGGGGGGDHDEEEEADGNGDDDADDHDHDDGDDHDDHDDDDES